MALFDYIHQISIENYIGKVFAKAKMKHATAVCEGVMGFPMTGRKLF